MEPHKSIEEICNTYINHHNGMIEMLSGFQSEWRKRKQRHLYFFIGVGAFFALVIASIMLSFHLYDPSFKPSNWWLYPLAVAPVVLAVRLAIQNLNSQIDGWINEYQETIEQEIEDRDKWVMELKEYRGW